MNDLINAPHFCASCGGPVSHGALLCSACMPLISPTIDTPWPMKSVGSISSRHNGLIWIDELEYEDAKTPVEKIKADLAKLHGVDASQVCLDRMTEEGNAMIGHFVVRKAEPSGGES